MESQREKIITSLKGLPAESLMLGLLLMVSVFFNRLMPICTIILFISLIWSRASVSEIKQRLSTPIVLLASLFILHLIGMTYSENLEYGWSDIGIKASLIVYPIFFLFTGIKLERRKIENFILIGLLLALIYSELMALYGFIQWPVGLAYFRGSYFSILMHRSYFGLYLFFGLLICSLRFLKNINLRNGYLYLSLFFALGAIQTFSKLALILVILYSVSFLIYLIIISRYKLIISLVAIALVGVFLVGVNSSDYLKRRIALTVESISGDNTNTKATESNNARIEMWKTSIELIEEAPLFGHGTGDVKDMLIKRSREKGNGALADKRLNSHNQFLNFGVSLGITGILLLVSWLVFTLRQFYREKNNTWFLFTIAIIIGFLTESFLETQAGIMPICLYLCVPYLTYFNRKDI